jgi:hypothetical protein
MFYTRGLMQQGIFLFACTECKSQHQLSDAGSIHLLECNGDLASRS